MKFQPLPEAVQAMIDAAAATYQVDPQLARALAWIESRGNQDARSAAGAIGIMQLMPNTARDLNVDPTVAAQNVDGGVRYLARLLSKYETVAYALAAYNWGPGNVDQYLRGRTKQPASVDAYVRNVLARKVEEGNRAAVGPFSGSPSLRLACPHCSCALRVEIEVSK